MKDYKALLKELVPELTGIFRDSVISIILYGSVARGTQSKDSDVDIAVIVKNYSKEMHDQMTDMLVDLELKYDKVLSVLLIDYIKFTEWENVMPFYKNVKKEGIVLWPAA